MSMYSESDVSATWQVYILHELVPKFSSGEFSSYLDVDKCMTLLNLSNDDKEHFTTILCTLFISDDNMYWVQELAQLLSRKSSCEHLIDFSVLCRGWQALLLL